MAVWTHERTTNETVEPLEPPTSEVLARRFELDFGADGEKRSPAASEQAQQQTFRWLVTGLFVIYMTVAIGIYLWRGIWFTPDIWAVFLLVGALVLGRLGSFIRDWIPFILLIFGYEFLRGIAGSIVVGVGSQEIAETERADFPSVQLEGLMSFDLALFAGREPISTIQDWFYTPGTAQWYDFAALIVYSMHFVLPSVFAFTLWLTRKERFWQFTLTFCLMTYAGFAFFLLYPAAPPWLAEAWGVTSGLVLPQDQVFAAIQPDSFDTLNTVKIWGGASPHPVAAMPSLHASFPWLVMLFAIRYIGWWGLLFIPYNLALWFAVVYTANHWVVDILAGIAWATIAFAVTDLIWHRLTRGGPMPVPRPIRRAADTADRWLAVPPAAVRRLVRRR